MNSFITLRSIVLLSIFSLLLINNTFSQQITGINYQGIARRADGNPLADQSISLKLTVRDGSKNGNSAFSEIHQVKTNPFGLFSVVIGSAAASSQIGTLANVNWKTGNKFLQVEIDPSGGNNFITMGTSQLQSVPYAIHAEQASPIGIASGDLTGAYPNPLVSKIQGKAISNLMPSSGQVLKWDGKEWIPSEDISGSAIRGEKGDKGDPGINGLNGTDGTPGINGTNGTDGAPGLKGDKGDPGINGTNGTNGAPGIKGDPGTNGTNGTDGAPGINGTNGSNGTDGAPGLKGDKGDPGTNGLNGTDGVPGLKGEKGDPGINGTNGTNGAPGIKGDPGINGTNGLNGAPGLKGDKGDPGTNGINGTNGLNGAPGLKGDPGTNGTNGTDGVPGLKGDKGDPGLNGTDGVPGLKGDKGDPGINGVNGTNGAPGLQGDKGDPGINGTNGADGTPGAKGDKGDPGTNGTDGTNGAPGLKGDKGDPGINGTNGLNGAPGTNGADGAPGLKGDKGDPGTNGTDGAPGINGTDGAPGINGTNGTNGTNGAPGLKGDKGDPGINGTNGTNGSPGLFGILSLINTAVQNRINGLPRLAGEKGDQGDPGVDGTNGTDGNPGLAGEKGEKGDQGDPGVDGTNGMDGAPGLVGEKGEKGDQGETGSPGLDGTSPQFNFVAGEIPFSGGSGTLESNSAFSWDNQKGSLNIISKNNSSSANPSLRLYPNPNDSSAPTWMRMGDDGVGAEFGISGGNDQFFQGTVKGDAVIKGFSGINDNDKKKLFIGAAFNGTANMVLNPDGSTYINGLLKAGGITYPTTFGNSGQVLTTNGSGLATWSNASLSGLSNFTESNYLFNTKTGVKLQASNLADNVDLVLSPKGTGAILAQQADGTDIGGNNRGSNAVDLQMFRDSSSQVASGSSSVIAGGNSNTASETYAVISGGNQNIASGNTSVVAGGNSNTASKTYAVISGGNQNTASGNTSVIAGGNSNTASETYAVISGGNQNIASGNTSVIAGGNVNTASKTYAVISGGNQNTASGNSSVIAGGNVNTASETYAVISGGNQNTASGNSAVVSGGDQNTASGNASVVVGGFANTASGKYSFVGGGIYNYAPSYGETVLGLFSTVGSGDPLNFNSLDRLFVIGNGTSTDTESRSNAITVLKNANTTIGGALTVNANGTNTSLTLPINRGNSGQVLTTNGAGLATWSNPTIPQDAATKAYVDLLEAKLVALEARMAALEPPIAVNFVTGKIWMDRNLGATQVASSSNDAASYGDLYQWGRGKDGHQIRTSATTLIPSSIDVPGNANFILSPNTPYDWRSSQNVNLWQGVNGVNNPCPIGYRLPTQVEWEAERSSWTPNNNNAAGALSSPLKLPVAGYRDLINGSLEHVGDIGYYWSGTVIGTSSSRLYFSIYDSSNAFMNTGARAYGLSVRCIKH